MTDQRATIIVTAALSPTGNAPATHYASSGYVPQMYITAMTSPVQLYTVAKKAWEDDGDVFPFTQQQVTNALANCTIVTAEHDPHAVLAQLGLKVLVV
jgi:hypothetical protein